MIGTTLLILSVSFLVVIIILEIIPKSADFEMVNKATKNQNTNLIIHLTPGILALIGVPLFVAGNQSPLVKDMFPTIMHTLYIGLILIAGAVAINIVRFERFGLGRRHATGTYREAVWIITESDDIQEGIKRAFEHIDNSRTTHGEVSRAGFLEYLKKSDDEELKEIAEEYHASQRNTNSDIG